MRSAPRCGKLAPTPVRVFGSQAAELIVDASRTSLPWADIYRYVGPLQPLVRFVWCCSSSGARAMWDLLSLRPAYPSRVPACPPTRLPACLPAWCSSSCFCGGGGGGEGGCGFH